MVGDTDSDDMMKTKAKRYNCDDIGHRTGNK